MDVWNDRILDIGLNALGYLIAGALGMLLYSVVYGRRRQTVSQPSESAPTAGRVDRSEASQFVDLRNQTKAPVAATGAGRRDKAEVVRLARKMMQAGADREMIKRTVPISDGELNLLEVAGSVR